jgi:hypothetical protein
VIGLIGWGCRARSCSARFAFAFALALSACKGADDVETLGLRLWQLSGCTLTSPSALQISALGDFPTRNAAASPRGASTALADLPMQTREVDVRADFAEGSAWGRQLLGSVQPEQPLLLLPAERSCALVDPQANVSLGAAVVALPSGGLLIVGGRDADGVPLFDAKLLPPNAQLVDVVANGMLLRRADASATLSGPSVIVAGGSGDVSGRAQETFEVFDLASAQFLGSRSGRMSGPRTRHAALLLANGHVLLAGGLAELDGPPLATAELLALTDHGSTATPLMGGLVRARIAPQLLGLDSGAVLLLGGSDQHGPVAGVERLDLTQNGFVDVPVDLPRRSELVSAALPGARVALVTCDAGDAGGCEASLLLPAADGFERHDLALPFAAAAPFGLADLRLLALADGALLLTGSDPSDALARRRAFVIDLNESSVTRVDASRVPTTLLLLQSGVVAELDAVGASLRAWDPLSAYACPAGNLISAEPARLVYDAPEHWQREGDALRAQVDGARLDVPMLRFADVQVSLARQGDVSLSFIDAGGSALEIAISADELQVGACRRQLQANAGLVALRRGAVLTLASGADAALCQVAAPDGPLALALHAGAGALIESLSVERR